MTEMTLIKPVVESCVDPLAPTIFHESWWLDTATGGAYTVADVTEKGAVVGRMPYCLTRKLGGVLVADLPPLTHFLGPVVIDCEGKPNKKFSYRQEITKQLILKLPKTASFYVKCHRDVADVIAFQGAGFRAGVQFTQELMPRAIDDIWQGIHRQTRQSINAARARYAVTEGNDPDFFMHFYAESFMKNKGKDNRMDMAVHAKLIRACLNRGRGKIYEAREHNGDLAASIFCAWDNVASYYLLTSRSPAAHHGSTLLLVWDAISDAVKRNLIFDFDGVSSEGVARAANNFCPALSPRYTALRESASMRIFRSVKSAMTPQSYYY